MTKLTWVARKQIHSFLLSRVDCGGGTTALSYGLNYDLPAATRVTQKLFTSLVARGLASSARNQRSSNMGKDVIRGTSGARYKDRYRTMGKLIYGVEPG
jgi:hypothetical protein